MNINKLLLGIIFVSFENSFNAMEEKPIFYELDTHCNARAETITFVDEKLRVTPDSQRACLQSELEILYIQTQQRLSALAQKYSPILAMKKDNTIMSLTIAIKVKEINH